MSDHTLGPLTTRRARTPDNTGGYDWAIVDNESAIVAECFEHVGVDGPGYKVRDAEANARLFAAAPELLAMLKELADSPRAVSMPDKMHRRVRAAIAKAEGHA